jgi:hypothetical protein
VGQDDGWTAVVVAVLTDADGRWVVVGGVLPAGHCEERRISDHDDAEAA